MAKKQFKAESRRLLDLMINSIYTHKEIFLREIISNASDAIDKLCYISLTDDAVGMAREDFRIRIKVDEDAGTVCVSDNGIGMNREDMENNLGVIARSGSLKFKSELSEEEAEKADIDIIGQFGVGFYSAFMVSDKVTVISRAYGSESAYKWESSGADGYTVSEAEKESVGTDIIMHIKEDTQDEKYSEYLDSFRLKELVKKYSDYVRWPIIMDVEGYESRETGEVDENGEPKREFIEVWQEQTVNSMIPIWQRAKSEVSDEDCKAFYKEKFHDAEEPLAVIRINAEGAVSYKAMLFIPATVPYDYYSRDFQPGLQLYSSGVVIMDKCAELLGDCFRFVRGIVDSQDLSLNISREMLQHDRQLKVIASNIEKKVKAELKKLLTNDRDSYERFWKAFGTQIKYGIVGDYGRKKDMLKDLLVFAGSGEEKLVSLEEYAKKMPEGQKYIYYAAADSVARAEKLPQTEQVREAGFGLLYMTEDVDEFVIQILGEYEGKKFCNVSSDDLGLETDLQKADTQRIADENREMLDFLKESLDGEVVDVRISHKLRSFPVCITTEGEITLEVERYFRSLPGANTENLKARKVLELNASHSAFKALKKSYEEDKEKAAVLAKILLCQAKLVADIPLDDPAAYTELVCGLF